MLLFYFISLFILWCILFLFSVADLIWSRYGNETGALETFLLQFFLFSFIYCGLYVDQDTHCWQMMGCEVYSYLNFVNKECLLEPFTSLHFFLISSVSFMLTSCMPSIKFVFSHPRQKATTCLINRKERINWSLILTWLMCRTCYQFKPV